jgi:hypothetical protein
LAKVLIAAWTETKLTVEQERDRDIRRGMGWAKVESKTDCMSKKSRELW